MKNKIFIATPMHNSMCHAHYATSMMRLIEIFTLNDISWDMRFTEKESLITRARNHLVRDFINTDCTHLIFIDSDIGFDPDDIIKMINADVDIICGAYPLKEINWSKIKESVNDNIEEDKLCYRASRYVFQTKKEIEFTVGNPSSKLIDIEACGTGFMMIKRTVFDKLQSCVPLVLPDDSKSESYRLYFDTGIDPQNKTYLSEDYNFCRIWKSLGGRIYLAPWIDLSHSGTYKFGGRKN